MNRIVGNVVIIDSAMGNALILTSANQALNLTEFRVNAFAFLCVDSTSTITISGPNTSDIMYTERLILMGTHSNNGTVAQQFLRMSFGTPQSFFNLKVPTLTNGTGFIYLA